MGLRRVEAELDLKSPPQKLYDIWKKSPHLMPQIAPKHLQAVEHHNGPWENHDHGSVKTWNYTHEGQAEVFKEKIEIDDANMKVRLVGLDGDVFKLYKTNDVIFQFIPKGTGTLAKITIEYVKLSDDMPDPITYLNLCIGFITDSDEHLVTKA